LEFIHDLRERVIGAPEISTDGFHPYKSAIRDVFAGNVSHGVIVKTYSVTNLAVKDAARRYSPAEVVAVERPKGSRAAAGYIRPTAAPGARGSKERPRLDGLGPGPS
jgi:hypothetical protein